MGLLQIIKETIVYRKNFKKIKNLDSKYFATLCDNWKEIQKLDCAYCYPYENKNPNFGHSTGEVPISVGIEAMLKNDLKANSIVLRGFQKEDEALIRKYIFLATGNDKIVCS